MYLKLVLPWVQWVEGEGRLGAGEILPLVSQSSCQRKRVHTLNIMVCFFFAFSTDILVSLCRLLIQKLEEGKEPLTQKWIMSCWKPSSFRRSDGKDSVFCFCFCLLFVCLFLCPKWQSLESSHCGSNFPLTLSLLSLGVKLMHPVLTEYLILSDWRTILTTASTWRLFPTSGTSLPHW